MAVFNSVHIFTTGLKESPIFSWNCLTASSYLLWIDSMESHSLCAAPIAFFCCARAISALTVIFASSSSDPVSLSRPFFASSALTALSLTIDPKVLKFLRLPAAPDMKFWANSSRDMFISLKAMMSWNWLTHSDAVESDSNVV